MCVLCAAIPATLALGAVDQAKLKESGPASAARARPISTRAGLLVAALVLASAFYHLKILSG
jgi:hypothetical protein